MLVTLRPTLDRLRSAHLQMRIDKCKFGYREIDYVGYHISGNGLSPIQGNVDAILSFPAPANTKELERFIGMVNYYREFLPSMAEIAEPLNRLRRKGQPFIWSSECSVAFEKLTELDYRGTTYYTIRNLSLWECQGWCREEPECASASFR